MIARVRRIRTRRHLGRNGGGKVRVFITGSADRQAHATAKTLLAEGHDVVVHVRSVVDGLRVRPHQRRPGTQVSDHC
ncbi:hypothetical protein EIQ28_15400 [Xanthomonas campestris pv. plantaginis]